MRSANATTTPRETMERVNKLKGMPLIVRVTRGRNKIERFEGKIEAIYPSVFTVRLSDGGLSSFSYADVMAKNVMFLKRKA